MDYFCSKSQNSMIFSSNPSKSILKKKNIFFNKFNKILKSNTYIKGKELLLFEKNFAKYIGSKYAVGVANGTDALELSLKSLDLKHNDEVITVSHTSPATITAILNSGLKPVLIDIDKDSYNIDLNKIKNKINTKTKAIVLVHLYGLSIDIEKLLSLKKLNNLKIIEDCSQAHGSTFNKKKVGSFGTLGSFSFYPTKNIGAIGDAGAITTNSKKLFNKLIMLREYGWDKNKESKFLGRNSRLDELQSGFLNIQLKFIDSYNNDRNKIAKNYYKKLNKNFYKLPIYNKKKFYHSFHLFVIQTNKRGQLIKFMDKNKIFLGIHYKLPCHMHKAFKKKVKVHENLYITEKIAKNIVSLPIYPGLKINDQNKIINLMNQFAKKYEN